MTVQGLHLWLAKTSLEAALRSAERMLPVIAAKLPPDREARATWAFAQLKDALEGREAVTQPAAAPGKGAA
jgi:hypothetical protein